MKKERIDLVTLIAAMAGLVILWSGGAGKELWFDERFLQVVSSQPLMEMMQLLRWENNPPLTFVLLRVWQQLFGSSELALRSFTLFPTLAFLVALFRMGRHMFGRGVAALAVTLGAVAGQVVVQAGEVRMYPWLMLETTIAMIATWSFARSRRGSDIVLMSAMNILGVYTHYTYVFFMAFQAIWLIWKAREAWAKVVGSMIVTAVAFSPWFVLSFLPKIQDLSTNVGIERITAIPWQVFLLPLHLTELLWFTGGAWRGVQMLGASAVMIGLLFFWLAWRRSRARHEDVSAYAFITMLVVIVMVILGATGLVFPKHATILIPAWLLAISAGVFSFPLHRPVKGIVIFFLLALPAVLSWQQARSPYVTYRSAAEVVERHEQAGDVVLVHPFNDEIAVQPYYQGKLPVRGFFPLGNPGMATLRDVIRYNFRVTLNADNVERLGAYVGQAERVWFFFDVSPGKSYWRGDLISQWFERNSFAKTEYREIFREVPPLLVRYDRKNNNEPP